MSGFTESLVEEAALAWLEGVGWQVVGIGRSNPQIACRHWYRERRPASDKGSIVTGGPGRYRWQPT